jgi:hypothetical protein
MVEKVQRAVFDKDNKPPFDELIVYYWLNISKEHNRRTFNQEIKSVDEVTFLIKEDI